jgi:hypothetical protein
LLEREVGVQVSVEKYLPHVGERQAMKVGEAERRCFARALSKLLVSLVNIST